MEGLMTSSSVEQPRRAGERAAELGPASVAICAYTMRRWDDLTEAGGSVLAQLRTGGEGLLGIGHNPQPLAPGSAGVGPGGAGRGGGKNGRGAWRGRGE